ncbi:MAG: HEPN domain-containing protein [Iphinoe sp. HA4291-MV1]|jgi:hypothetical protein|nr:HEPN domain-containing protein [Iphinoe sp. HA4291-MV1]
MFDWLEYFHLAKKLASEAMISAHQEAQLRVTIHLAYYAAFNLAKKHLQDKEEHSIPTTGDAHSYVSEQFLLNPDSVHKSVGRKMKRLRLFRNQADYAAFFPGLSNFTTASITLAEEIISTLNSI